MCGIAGFVQPPSRADVSQLAADMADTLRHRGPDDHGVWCDPTVAIALGHTRLSIVDLSPAGHQPMVSRDGRWVLVFNGEIYNHGELRTRLEATGVALRGNSDTEVLLETVATWGPEKSIGECNGMFALALWDRSEDRLLLARDRMGEKPLYYTQIGQAFLFGSELKALHRHPKFTPSIDPGAVALYTRYGYVPCPRTIFEGVHKLPPGCLLSIRPDAAPGVAQPYWTVASAALAEHAQMLPGSIEQTADAVEALLDDAVGLRMRADVPVGAFLSGGIDSSLIVALMARHTLLPVRTFSIGFTEDGYNEAPFARAVAAHLGTEHTELMVTPHEAQQVIPDLASIYDEPFADSSQIPTTLLARMTRTHVTVALSGDGGDELFAGYLRYAAHARMNAVLRRLPPGTRGGLSRVARSTNAAGWERRLAPLRGVLHPWAPPGRLGERVVRAGELLRSDSPDLYRLLLSTFSDPTMVAPTLTEPPGVFPFAPATLAGTAALRYVDQMQYLPDDILVKVDRATMSVGLEARVPMLDHRLVELSWQLPESALLHKTAGKQVLREILARHVPVALTDRPKAGFGVPIGDWLRGPLRAWAGDLLSAKRLYRQGLFDHQMVRLLLSTHMNGDGAHGARLWNLLMFQAWHERWMQP